MDQVLVAVMMPQYLSLMLPLKYVALVFGVNLLLIAAWAYVVRRW